MNQIQSITPVVSIINQTAITTSIDVARVFEKRHDHIIRTIEQLREDCGVEYLPNFGEASYEAEQPNGGKATYKCYNLTRDGFTLLAMGFTGKKALQFKLAYIAQFNAMESSLQQAALPAPSTITKEQVGIIYQTLCAKYPNGDNRHAAWSRFNKHFNLNEYKSLPAHRFDEALKWLGGVVEQPALPAPAATESQALPFKALLPNQRYLVCPEADGYITFRPLKNSEFVNSMSELAKSITELSFGTSDENLLNIIDACKKILAKRVSAAENRLQSMKKQLQIT